MKPKQRDSKVETSNEDEEFGRCKIYKRDALLVTRVLGVIALIFGSIATVILKNSHAIAPGLFTASVTLTLSALDFWIWYRHIHHSKRIVVKWPFAAAAIFIALGLTTTIIYEVVPFGSPITILNASGFLVRDRPNGPPGVSHFVAARRYPPGLHQVSALYSIEILNRAALPVRYRGYRIEVQRDWLTWEKACKLDLRELSVYWLDTSLQDARLLTIESLDKKLERPIQPQETVSGWIAWKCAAGACPNSGIRIVLFDVNDGTSTAVFPKPGNSTPSELLDRVEINSERTTHDISNSPLIANTECSDQWALKPAD